MIYLGVDPDTHNLPMAILGDGHSEGVQTIDTPFGALSLQVLRVPRELTGQAAVIAMIQQLRHLKTPDGPKTLCVEMQHYVVRSRSRPEDIARLSCISGGVMGAIQAERILAPLPMQWKGNVPKVAHHQRIGNFLGWYVRKVPGF